MTAAYIFAAVIAACFGAMVFAAMRAPLGWQERDGFHHGEPDEHGNPDNLGI